MYIFAQQSSLLHKRVNPYQRLEKFVEGIKAYGIRPITFCTIRIRMNLKKETVDSHRDGSPRKMGKHRILTTRCSSHSSGKLYTVCGIEYNGITHFSHDRD